MVLAGAAVVIACSNPKPVVVANGVDPSRMELDVYCPSYNSPVNSPSQEALFLLDTERDRAPGPSGAYQGSRSWYSGASMWALDADAAQSRHRPGPASTTHLDTTASLSPADFAAEIPRLSGVDARSFRVAQRCPARVTGACATIGFSHVGFRDDGRQAVVYMEYDCGPLCADADYFVLERDGADGWHITKTIGVWESIALLCRARE